MPAEEVRVSGRRGNKTGLLLGVWRWVVAGCEVAAWYTAFLLTWSWLVPDSATASHLSPYRGDDFFIAMLHMSAWGRWTSLYRLSTTLRVAARGTREALAPN